MRGKIAIAWKIIYLHKTIQSLCHTERSEVSKSSETTNLIKVSDSCVIFDLPKWILRYAAFRSE